MLQTEITPKDIKDYFPVEEIEIDLKSCVPNKWNPNIQTESVFNKLKDTLQQIGFIQPILVREYVGVYQIIDGFHRWRACQELGWKKIKAWKLINDIDDNTAKMLTLIMNNTRGKDEILKRAELLKQLNEGQLQLLPFSKEDIDFEKKLLEFDFSRFENTKIEESTQKDKLQEAIIYLRKVHIIFDEIYNNTNNTNLRIFIEDFKQMYRILEQFTSKEKEL